MTFYESARTALGRLQRGLGRSARQAPDPADVYACVRSDHRVQRARDAPAVYLVRGDVRGAVRGRLTACSSTVGDYDDGDGC